VRTLQRQSPEQSTLPPLQRPRPARPAPAPPAPPRRRVDPDVLVLGFIMLAALGLRLWSIDHGLPFAYNYDEDKHFVSIAIRVAEGDLNPHYFDNPPALTYLLAAIFRVGIPYGTIGLAAGFLADQGPGFLVGRLVVALLSVAALPVVYWAGRRWFDRRAGLVAAALLATAFLPTFYAKQALNDTVTLLPLTIGLVACLAVAEGGRPRSWLLAGAAFGAATATKYTAGAALITLLLAAAFRLRQDRPPAVARNLALALAVFGGIYLAINPYTLLDFGNFIGGVVSQAGAAGGIAKLGHDQVLAPLYYLSTLTWGFGWAALLAAAAGAVLSLRADLRRGLLLAAFPVLLFCFLSLQARFFARWLLLAYPALALFAGYAVTRVADLPWLAQRARPAAIAVLTGVLAVQGILASTHVNQVLGQADTRQLAEDWLAANVPSGTKVVIEPFTPSGYLKSFRGGASRFAERPVTNLGGAAQYQRSLVPGVVDDYRRQGQCWIVVGSYQKERGLKAGLPGARAYYERLQQEATRVATFSPYRAGEAPVPFSFDFSFNYLPRAFERPGPVVEVYQLTGCPGGPQDTGESQ
jgi:4-amino-4-deoxy-L-arabinose transferase-like glycosyltransferase